MGSVVAICLFADLLTGADGELAEVVEGTVVDVEVNIALDARQAADIGMLPELPGAFVLYFVDVVVGYPIVVVVEDRVAEIAGLKFIIGVDDGLDTIVAFDDLQPFEDAGLELLVSLLLRFVLDVKDGRQVTVLELDLTDEETCLVGGR